MQWTKSRLATWLLISLLPTGILGFISFVGFAIATPSQPTSELFGSGWQAFWWVLTVLLWPYWWIALVVGVVLKIWAGNETRRLYREGRQYAELHGWQQISGHGLEELQGWQRSPVRQSSLRKDGLHPCRRLGWRYGGHGRLLAFPVCSPVRRFSLGQRAIG